MENASKALIIAGAILLAILIIALGVAIYQQASGVVNSNSMTEVEVTTFNEKFTQYIGKKIRGANVNALINAVNTNNMSTDDDSKVVSITGTGFTADSSGNYPKAAKTGATYTVEVKEYTTGGLIKTINITENTSGASN